MFSEGDTFYRAGIYFVIRGKRYAYSRAYFMKYFVEYTQRMYTKVAENVQSAIKVSNITSLLAASKSIIDVSDVSKSSNKETLRDVNFIINECLIRCPSGKHAYLYNDMLLRAFPEVFKESKMSYIQLARFVLKLLNERHVKNDSYLADLIIRAIMTGNADEENELISHTISILIAVLFVAEIKRNPSCFLPTLMLLVLISNNCHTPFGDLYTWSGCLQNETLVYQDEPYSFLQDSVYPSLVGTPSKGAIHRQAITEISDYNREFLNASKKHNRIVEQKQIEAHEHLMQLGGYFPMSHRFSYTELITKRASGEETLSDKKNFIAICDYLALVGRAQFIHHNQLNLGHYPSLDRDSEILTKVILPELWESTLRLARPDFNAVKIYSYPSLLTFYKRYQKKLTPESVAHTIFMVHGSSRYGKEEAKQLKREFHFWSLQNNFRFGLSEVESVISSTYRM